MRDCVSKMWCKCMSITTVIELTICQTTLAKMHQLANHIFVQWFAIELVGGGAAPPSSQDCT